MTALRYENGKARWHNDKARSECCCSPITCACDPWPPEDWPCSGLHYEYLISLTLNWEHYGAADCGGAVTASGSCSISGLSVIADLGASCTWYTTGYATLSCGGFIADEIGAEFWYDWGTAQWKVRLRVSISGGGGTAALADATNGTSPTGPYTEGAAVCTNGLSGVGSAKIWATNLEIAAGTDP